MVQEKLDQKTRRVLIFWANRKKASKIVNATHEIYKLKTKWITSSSLFFKKIW